MFQIVEFSSEWHQVDTTCDTCTACKEIIYGKQYQLFLNNQPTEQIICEPCYQEVMREDE